MKKLDAKKKEREMSKLSDTLAKALAKKQGKTHVDGSDATPTVEKKTKGKPAAPAGLPMQKPLTSFQVPRPPTEGFPLQQGFGLRQSDLQSE